MDTPAAPNEPSARAAAGRSPMGIRRPPSAPDACSVLWDRTAEPVWGSAAGARFWLAVEQHGPWGHSAFTQSRMDPDIGATLERACAYAGGRALLIRAVGDHRGRPGRRHVYLSGGMPQGQPWLLAGFVEDLSELLALDWAAVRDGDAHAVMATTPALRLADAPILLVCTNARRDACCAVRGRPIALAASQLRPRQVWECTHTGGHRFAPTGVVLPTGQTLGRLDEELAVAALDAAAQGNLALESLRPEHNRGLAHLSPPLQAAEAWVRSAIGEEWVGALSAQVSNEGGAIEVSHIDGRTWNLRALEVPIGCDLKGSCTAAAKPASSWQITQV